MIEVNNLTKRYGSHVAVENVSFRVEEGEILGFLGPNGAGKSTTMNIITGYLSATSGNVTIDGFDILESPKEAKSRIGYLPELPPLYLDMTVKEYLNYVYELKKVKMPKGPHIAEICKLVKIKDVYNRLIKNLSKGYRQRVGIAQALIGNPPVLILDEPTVGLDPKQIVEIRALIKLLGKTHTVILSSHILSEVQAICDRVVIISNGHIVVDDTPDNLSFNLSDDHSLSVRIDGPRKLLENELRRIPGVKAITCTMEHAGYCEFVVEPVIGYDIARPLFELLSSKHWPLLSISSNELTLEDIFLRLTDGSADSYSLEKALASRRENSAKEAETTPADAQDSDSEGKENIE